MKTIHRLFSIFVLAALLAGAIAVQPALAATTTVTNSNDSGAGSLRFAITSAAVGDTITFDPTLSGATIRLGSVLTLAQDITIDGSALATPITISGDTDNSGTPDVQVFIVNAGVTATLKSLSITKGTASDGGGIQNSGTLTVLDSSFTANKSTFFGGGIDNNGMLTVTHCVFTSNSSDAGGAIDNYGGGTATITDSTFSSNNAVSFGGALNNESAMTVDNSTLDHNTSDNGAGIENYNATLTVTNSTFYKNISVSWGGGIENNSTLTVINSTFSENSAPSGGGGIDSFGNSGILNYSNTVIANSVFGGDCLNTAALGANVNNLVENGGCAATKAGDPKLNPLADNGGLTQTMSLQAGSPAIDTGDNAACPTTDQRGNTRPVDGDSDGSSICDIGAVEVNAVPTGPVPVFPTNGVVLHDNRPVFDWTDFPGAASYQLQASKAVDFKSLALNRTLKVSTYAPTTNLPASSLLYWRVRAKVGKTFTPWSAAWTFTTGNPPSVPALTTPTPNALLDGPSPLFNWNNSTLSGTAVFDHYQLQIATDAAFTAVFNSVNVSGITNSQDNSTILSSGTTYYWRVRSFNVAGDYSAWSLVRSVRVKFNPPTLSLPVDASVTASLLPTFTLSAVGGATNYTLQVSKSSAFAGLAINKTVTVPTFTATTSLTAGTKYYWRVRVNGPYGPSAWSAVFSFTTP